MCLGGWKALQSTCRTPWTLTRMRTELCESMQASCVGAQGVKPVAANIALKQPKTIWSKKTWIRSVTFQHGSGSQVHRRLGQWCHCSLSSFGNHGVQFSNPTIFRFNTILIICSYYSDPFRHFICQTCSFSQVLAHSGACNLAGAALCASRRGAGFGSCHSALMRFWWVMRILGFYEHAGINNEISSKLMPSFWCCTSGAKCDEYGSWQSPSRGASALCQGQTPFGVV